MATLGKLIFVSLFLCALWENVEANDGISARLSKPPSLPNKNIRLRAHDTPPPPSSLTSPPPPPPPPSPPSPPPPSPAPPPPSPPSPPPPPPPLPPSSYAVLSDIYVSSGTLVPPFNESIFTYTISVNSTVSELQVSVIVPEDEVEAGYEVSVNGTLVDSGAAGPTFELADEGETATIYIYIVATGYTSSLYTIYVTREESSSSASGGGGLSWWEIVLIVVACVVVAALIAGAVYWASRKGWLSKSTTDYESMP